MSDFGQHVCMLPAALGVMAHATTPTAGLCSRVLARARRLLLATQWHHAVARYLRSRKSLAQEQTRQLTTAHWATLHPYSPMKFSWDCFAFVVNCITFIYMPIQVFIPCSNPYDPLVLFSDLVACFEIVVNFLTGRLDKNEKSIILEHKAIAKSYLKSTFVFDVIAALPLQVNDLVEPFDHCEYPSHTAMYVFKLFRLLPMNETLKNLHRQFATPYSVSHSTTVFLQTSLFFHWGTYLHFQAPALFLRLYGSDQMMDWMERYKVAPAYNVSSLEKYIVNLYRLGSLAIGAGLYSPVDKPVIPELLLTAALGMVGLLFMTYSLTAIFRLVIYKHFEIYLYNGRLRELQEYLLFKRLPASLLKKVQLFINYKFNGHYFNEESILSTVNDQIRQEMNMYCCKRLVGNVPLFQDLPIALLNTIIFSLKQLLYMPGELVVKCGHPGSSIYLIASGTVAVINSQGREVAHLKDGAFFGEKALLNPGTPRSATIIALEITEIYKLTNKEFQACLQLCPRMKRRLATRRAAPRAPPDEELSSLKSYTDDTR